MSTDVGGVCQRQGEESDTSPLVIHEGRAVKRGFIAEISLRYIELKCSDSLCKSNTLLIKYWAGLNILNVAYTRPPQSALLWCKRVPSVNPWAQQQGPVTISINANLLRFAAWVGKFGTKWDYDGEWGTQIRVWWPMKNHGASDFGVLSSESPFSRRRALKKKKKEKKVQLSKNIPPTPNKFSIQAIVEGKRLCVSH